jgi:hypothetical protein
LVFTGLWLLSRRTLQLRRLAGDTDVRTNQGLIGTALTAAAAVGPFDTGWVQTAEIEDMHFGRARRFRGGLRSDFLRRCREGHKRDRNRYRGKFQHGRPPEHAWYQGCKKNCPDENVRTREIRDIVASDFRPVLR